MLTITESAVSTAGTTLSTIGLGDEYRYHIVVRNTGGAPATGAIVRTTLSTNHRLVATPAGCTASGLALTCALASVPSGGSVTIDVRVRAGFGCTVLGTSGNDTLTGTTASDIICGGGGSDTITGNGGTDTVYGYGNRVGGLLTLTSVSNQASLAWNAVTTTTATVLVSVAGTDGNDTITTGSGVDTILGEEGGDIITAGAGADTVNGGAGPDDVYGAAGNDRLFGDAGNDVIYGQGDDDLVGGGDDNDYGDGGPGNDTVSGNYGRDTMVGGIGNDIVDGGPANGTAAADPDNHYNRLYGNGGTDSCSHGPGTGVNDTDFRHSSCEPAGTANPRANFPSRRDRGPAI